MQRSTWTVALLGLVLAGCASSTARQPSDEERLLGGEHRLRQMVEQQEHSGSITGGYFLILGGIDGKVKTSVSVKFAWQMNDGIYAISSLPLEKIRVKLDDRATTPTIQFHWGYVRDTKNLQLIMDNSIEYAVVTAHPRDWPIRIRLPFASEV